MERGPRIAALRELFEECGVIAAADFVELDPAEAQLARTSIENGQLNFLDFVKAKQIRLDLSRLTLFSRWLTPPVVPKRFDTFFYLVRIPAGQTVSHDGRETVGNEWVTPAEALRRGKSGERIILFPTRMNLRLLSKSESYDRAVASAVRRPRHQVLPTIEVRDGQCFIRLAETDGYGLVEEVLQIG